jgi:hypothetical protein
VFAEPLATELRDLFNDGVLVDDAHTSTKDALVRVMLLHATSDYRGIPKLAENYQHPGLNGACILCEILGVHHDAPISTTIYRGAHRFLPADHPVRGDWVRGAADVELGMQDAAAPRPRTATRVEEAGRAAELDEKVGSANGYHCRSIFQRGLEYFDPTIAFYYDPMHLLANAGTLRWWYCFCLL